MKVLAVAGGGCGGMGRFAVHASLALDFIEEIVAVDLDFARAGSFAEMDDRMHAGHADVRDHDRLCAPLEPADVVPATVDPDYAFGTQILRAAIDTVVTGLGSGDSQSDCERKSDSGRGAAVDHLIQQTSGEIRLRQDSHWRDVKPLDERVVEYPGIGSAVRVTKC